MHTLLQAEYVQDRKKGQWMDTVKVDVTERMWEFVVD
jgi:hypothetical protein